MAAGSPFAVLQSLGMVGATIIPGIGVGVLSAVGLWEAVKEAWREADELEEKLEETVNRAKL